MSAKPADPRRSEPPSRKKRAPTPPPSPAADDGGIPRRVKLEQLRPRGDRPRPPARDTSPATAGEPTRKRRSLHRPRKLGMTLSLAAAFVAGLLVAGLVSDDDAAAPARGGLAVASPTTLQPTGKPLEGARARASLTGQAFSRLTVNFEAAMPRDYSVALVSERRPKQPVFLTFQRRGRTVLRQALSWRTLPQYERLAVYVQEPRGRGARRRLVPREVLRVSVDKLVQRSQLRPE